MRKKDAEGESRSCAGRSGRRPRHSRNENRFSRVVKGAQMIGGRPYYYMDYEDKRGDLERVMDQTHVSSLEAGPTDT